VNVDANGNFSFTTALALNGTADGAHTVRFVARDRAGNTSTAATFTFTLATAITQPAFDLDAASDTFNGGVAGNHRTGADTVTLEGRTDANAMVELVGTGRTTTADDRGRFSFDNVTLAVGVNEFTVRATDDQSNSNQFTRVIVRNSDVTVADPVEDFDVATNAQATILNLPGIFSDADVNSAVRLSTPAGDIDLELFDQQTPETVKNYLRYIDAGRYDSTIFHRSVSNFVIQGGGFTFSRNATGAFLNPVQTFGNLQNEPGISNQRGTVAMAKLGGDPNSATSQFFFNLADNSRGGPALDSQNGGFTAFGQLRGNSQAVVDALAAIPTQNRATNAATSAFGEIPLQNYPAPPGGDFPSDTFSSNYAFLTSASVTRRVDTRNGDALAFEVVGNTNTALVNAQITGGKLTLNYTAGMNGSSTITLRARDVEGRTVETSFTVRVVRPGA
jgi:cyclophilin family peptidyl-prolyl cis-trans isomerase